MQTTPPRRSKTSFSLQEFHAAFPDEEAARAWFERTRWPNGPVCAQCGSVGNSRWLKNVRRWSCRDCTYQFTVMTNTPMHRSHLQLLTWAGAMYLMVTSSKGISSVKLGEMLGITQKTSWFLGQRIRAMMDAGDPLLSGIVEIDETFAGAAPRVQAASDATGHAQPDTSVDTSDSHDDDTPPSPPPSGGKNPHPKGRDTKRPMVLVAVERSDGKEPGRSVSKRLTTHSNTTIASALDGVLRPGTVVMTDGLPAYRRLVASHEHHSVVHSAKVFARTDDRTGIRAHVNTAESWFATLHRAVVGVFHSVSAKHLERYASETAFRWNTRARHVLDRMASMVARSAGKRLTFAMLSGPGVQA